MSSGERRASPRHFKRAQVRFWSKEESDKTHTGYTRNLSGNGVFICTHKPFPRGTRLCMEVTEADTRLLFEGIVARRTRVDPELRKMGESGMGVRFLRPEELIRELRARATAGPGGTASAGIPALESGRDHQERGLKPPPPPPSTAKNVFPVRFPDARSFLETFVRDVASGGLFIPTPSPPALDASVTVELFPPDLGEESVIRLAARVVHRLDAGSPAASGRPGIGVAFLDPQAALRSFEPHIARLKNSGR